MFEEVENIVPAIALGAFGVALLFFLILSWVLNYHWSRYGITSRELKLARRIYFGVSFALIIILVILIAFGRTS